jgi:hypothetical protein
MHCLAGDVSKIPDTQSPVKNGQQGGEKMLNAVTHQENANENHNQIQLHTH